MSEYDGEVTRLQGLLAAANEKINEYATAMFEAGAAYGKCQLQITARDAQIKRLEKLTAKIEAKDRQTPPTSDAYKSVCDALAAAIENAKCLEVMLRFYTPPQLFNELMAEPKACAAAIESDEAARKGEQ